jgi:hypothetical protein
MEDNEQESWVCSLKPTEVYKEVGRRVEKESKSLSFLGRGKLFIYYLLKNKVSTNDSHFNCF